MKNILVFISLLGLAPLLHASTCETRVDSHQKASTLERTYYCLTPEQAAPELPGPTLIYENVTTKAPENETVTETVPLKQEYYPQNEVSVTRGYVGTAYFPKWKNDIISEQERRAQQGITPMQTGSVGQTSGRAMTRTVQYPVQTVASQLDDRPVKGEEKPARTMAKLQGMMQQIEAEVVASSPQVPNTVQSVPETASVAAADAVTREADALFASANQ